MRVFSVDTDMDMDTWTWTWTLHSHRDMDIGMDTSRKQWTRFCTWRDAMIERAMS